MTVAAPSARGDGLISEIDLRDITVGDALRILSTQYGINVVASEKAAKIKTALFLRDVKPIEVLDTLAKAYNLWYQEDPQSKIIRLFTVDEFRLGQVDSVPEETEIFTMRYPNATDVAYVIRNLFGDRVVLSEATNQAEVNQELQARFQRFDLVDRRRSGIGITGGGGSSGGGGGGGSSVSGLNSRGPSTNQNRVDERDVEEVMGSTKRFTGDATTRGQLAGEASEGQELMGEVKRRLSPIYVTVIRSQNRVLVRTRDPDAMREIRALVQKLDVSQSTLLMEVKVLSVNLSDGYHSAFDFNINAGDFSVTGIPGFGGISKVIPPIAPIAGTALLATVVNDKFQARLQLLEKEGRVTELATPMLITTNQEVSRIFVGQERPIVTGYTSSSPTGIGTTGGVTGSFATPILVPQIQTRPLGTTLLLTPNINADHTVNIRMVIEQSKLNPEKAEIQVPNLTTGQTSVAKVDVVDAQTFSGSVLGKDDVAVAVGGLITDSASDQTSKTPVLGDIPLLGILFKDEEFIRGRSELIIIIKPHIQDTPTETAEVSQEFLHNESVHPNARAMGGNMDIYRNPGRHHDNYTLQQRYKFYDNQDQFDEYHRRTRNPEEEPSMPPNTPPAFPPRNDGSQADANPQDYLGLTRFAALVARKPDAGKNPPLGISEAGLVALPGEPLLDDRRLQTEPLESWKKGNLYVTTVQVANRTDKTINVDYAQVRGQWLASTIETPRLARKGMAGDSTLLYLVSKEPFHEALRR
jgi:general secretion pathway protein D